MDSSQRLTPQTSLAKSADLASVAGRGCSDQDASGRLPARAVLDVSRLDTQASSTFSLDGTRQHSDSSSVPCTPVVTPSFSTRRMRSGLGR